MFKNARKDDLRIVAIELGENVTDTMTVPQLMNAIKGSELFKSDPDLVKDLVTSTVENRISEEQRHIELEQRQIELEKIKLERMKTELELAKVKGDSNYEEEINDSDKTDSLDNLIRSIRTLTIRVPFKPEGWGFFFTSLERAFVSKNVPEKYKAEILLNLLGEKASNVLIYINDDELNNYEKVKSIVLREFEPSPQSCLENFRKATRLPNENHVQFASRLTTNWDYYLKLRNVSDFETLNQLLISDKICQTLDKDTFSHINIRQADTWFKPIELAKEIDLY